MNLRESRHLIGLTKEIEYPDFSDIPSTIPLLLPLGKSYCNNSDLLVSVSLPISKPIGYDPFA